MNLIIREIPLLRLSIRTSIECYFNICFSETPYLNDYLKYWVSNGGIYAMAHVRGGGEKGNTWHNTGKKLTKPNTWKDFIAYTEFMIKEK